MKAKQIELLKKQIAKLEEKEFDLEVWKISTILLLEKIFGKTSSEIKQIKDISGDMSSWTLRDNLGDVKSDRSRLLGKQILETCIDELDLSDDKTSSGKTYSDNIESILKNELTGSQLEKIKNIIEEKISKESKIDKLNNFLNALDKSVLSQILSGVISK